MNFFIGVMSKIKISVSAKDKDKDLPDIRNKNIVLLKKKLSYIDEQQLLLLEETIHDRVVDKATRLGIPIDYMDSRFIRLYCSNIRHYRLNLDKNSYVNNLELPSQIESGKITMNDVLSMSSMDLYKERWESFRKTEEAEIHVILTGGEGGIEQKTDLYRCGRCKGNSCAYREEQSRSADEGSTHRVRCLECGNKWNHYN
jgi:DNA-directed RNA polymerase subunit M/transcription elongation factor TFIIS